MSVKKVVLGLIFIIIIVFALQNLQMCEIQFLFFRLAASRALIVAVAFLLGLISGWLLKKQREQSPTRKPS